MTRTWNSLVLAALLLAVVVSAGQERTEEVQSSAAVDLAVLPTEDAGEQAEVENRARLLMGGQRWRYGHKNGRRLHSCSRNVTVCKDKESRGPDCCHGRCTRVTSDSYNCGKCGSQCGERKMCCAGKCVDIYVDTQNCGSCAQKCLIDEYCYRGLCNYNGPF